MQEATEQQHSSNGNIDPDIPFFNMNIPRQTPDPR